MRIMLIGACIGFVVGAVLGGGGLGLLGLLAGGGFGAFTGAIVLPLFTSASAGEFARHAHLVSCPASGTLIPVTVTRESALAASFHPDVTPEIADCPRWREHGKCSGPCASELHV